MGPEEQGSSAGSDQAVDGNRLIEDERDIIRAAQGHSANADSRSARFTGLALSGGGIRSATFNLGVLQSLAKLKLLMHVDYLSTVSGGGYIGSWLLAWIHNEQTNSESAPQGTPSKPASSESGPPKGLKRVAEALGEPDGNAASKQTCPNEYSPTAQQTFHFNDKQKTGSEDLSPEPPQIRHLRDYSNYLTPRLGLWSLDTWSIWSSYIRNFLITAVSFVGALLTLAFAMKALATAYDMEILERDVPTPAAPDLLWLSAPFWLTIVPGLIYAGTLGKRVRSRQARMRIGVYFWAFANLLALHAIPVLLYLSPSFHFLGYAGLGMIPVLLLIVPLTTVRIITRVQPKGPSPLFPAAAVLALIGRFLAAAAVLVLGLYARDRRQADPRPRWRFKRALTLFLAITIATFTGTALFSLLHRFIFDLGPSEIWQLQVFGAVLGLLVFTASHAILIGLSGRALEEQDREWLARFQAILAQWTLISALLFGFSNLDKLWASGQVIATSPTIAAALWFFAGIAGAWFAKNPGVVKKKWLVSGIAIVTPAIFFVGLFFIAFQTVDYLSSQRSFIYPWVDQLSLYFQYRPRLTELLILVVSGLGLFLFTVIWLSLVGVNRFSLHSLYGNRLVRTYLGASNPARRHRYHGSGAAFSPGDSRDPYTDFDVDDNGVRMSDLSRNAPRPYLIVNAAINLVSGKRLAWQKRKAGSFVFTPRYSGYQLADTPGVFVPTEEYADKEGGVSLGKAMTISGAAASPNMGYHSSPGLTFLMAFFNVRLGWWLPNPGSRQKPKKKQKLLNNSSPPAWYLFSELFGKTHEESRYIYLSDGGHFENLGIYELVRRRCHFIIACDAECDPDLGFSGLGNAIEKCRTDFGISIDIDVSQIQRNATGFSRWHCAVGCIRYSEVDEEVPDGTLLYIKASLTGREPRDVMTYAHDHHKFPHETTADQWFDENQFESYRALGKHTAQEVVGLAARVAEQQQSCEKRTEEDEAEYMMQRVALEVRKQWYPKASRSDRESVDENVGLNSILDALRADPLLSYLDRQLFPNLPRARLDSENQRKSFDLDAPRSYDELRAGFYLCSQILAYIEQVYHDRHLDIEYAAPTNRGWMNLFRRWAFTEMVRFTWALTAGSHSARFQTFCEYHLGLTVGTPEFSERPLQVDPEMVWRKLAEEEGLHPYEIEVARQFIETCERAGRGAGERGKGTPFEIRPLTLRVDDPYHPHVSDRSKALTLTMGFAITGPSENHPEGAVVYLRIRSSMRNLDLARKTFKAMGEKLGPVDLVEKVSVPPDDGALPWQEQVRHELNFLRREDLSHCHWFSEYYTKRSDNQPDQHRL